MSHRLFLLIFLAVFSFASGAKAKKRKPAQIDPTTRVMVTVKNTARVDQWLFSFPLGTQIVRQIHPFYVVQLKKPITPEELAKVRANPYVKKALQDSAAQLSRKSPFADQCIKTAQSNNLEDLENMIDQAGVDCDLAMSCSADDKPALQAQLAVGGDLMALELKRMGLPDGHTKVAVIDSGFNPNLMQFMARPPKWYGDIDDPQAEMNEDGVQHGSPVAGLIGGKNGVGLSPGAELGIYQIPVNENGIGTVGDVLTAAQTACAAGHKIINISFEKIYTDRDDPEMVSMLAEKGCMVVNSAGNHPGSGIKNTSTEDAWLRVGGKEVETGNNAPCELGEVNAPGFGVATLDSTSDSTCGGQPLQPINGTSFAAPIASAILANVRGILAKDPEFDKLKGPQQIKLLNAMIGKSTVGGMVNGLRAVMMAEAWTKVKGTKPIGAADVDRLLTNNKPAACAQPAKSSDLENLACSERKTALADARFRAMVCSPPVDEEALTKLIRGLVKLDEPTLAKNLTHHMPKDGAGLREDIQLNELAASQQEFEEAEKARVEATREMREEIAQMEAMNFDAVGADTLKGWTSSMQSQQLALLGNKVQTQKKIDELSKDPTANRGQLISLNARVRSIDSALTCYAGWRTAMLKVGPTTSAAQFHEWVANTKQATGCNEPVEYVPGLYQGVAQNAIDGGMYLGYQSAFQNELDVLKEEILELESGMD